MPYYAYKARNSRGDLVRGIMEGADDGAVADELFSTGLTPVDIEETDKVADDNAEVRRTQTFFAYRARNVRGELLKGVVESPDSVAVASLLMNTGLTPIDIVPAKPPSDLAKKGILGRLSERKVLSQDVQLFSRQMHTLLKAGVPILRALASLQESATNHSFARVIRDVRTSLDAGRELSAAMARNPKVFTPFYQAMIRIGEVTGRLDDVFLRLFGYLEFDREMRNRVRTALRYPSFVLAAMVIAIGVINVFVIPAFAQVYASFNTELPLMTRVLIASSNFTVKYWPGIVVGAAAAGIAFKMYTGTRSGRYRWHKLMLRIPLAGTILTKAALARFARSFALGTRSGVPVVQALSVVAQTVDNAYISSRIEQMREGVERGESVLRVATAMGIFTPIVLQMISVGEETGALDDLMDEIAQMYENEVDYELKTLASRIEPILIVFLGILVLILALGVFLPIWDLSSNMKR
ncbi:type II secretion system F family protein [Noviherbaspirillum sp. ST9]|uniref:type II secretion system F family protein n=1 Tax=Noviherbaspirillum sp. ST9 TaxID=3401606 RepID=UPI003B5878D9